MSLRADVKKAIANYPPGDTRYLTRLERQHERLQNPDLELIVRLVTRGVHETWVDVADMDSAPSAARGPTPKL